MAEKNEENGAHESASHEGSFKPHVSASETLPEFTIKAAVAGILFGIVFGAANAYLGLVAGLTISTSIPVAVMTVAAFRLMSRAGVKSSILEANLSQTVGSASSSVASGVIFTLPALFLWELAPTLGQMITLALCGGLLGVLFMIPLRRFLIDREHGRLPYPEGTACAEVLVASELGGARARNVFLGLGVGALFKLIVGGINLVPDTVKAAVPGLAKGQIGLKLSAALFGVGYILGPRIGAIMVSGGLLSSLVIIPAIGWWGAERVEPLYPEPLLTIAEMDPGDIWERYVRYIGAGAVATAGIITLIRSMKTMFESFRLGVAQLGERTRDAVEAATARTHQDLPLKAVGLGAVVVACVMTFVPGLFGALDGFLARAITSILVVIFAFFFVTVAARIVGLIGVTSNPTSGMTICALLGTSSVFLVMGWTGDAGKVGALCVGCVVAIAASISGDTSQDLKTGFLLGATPKKQQLGELLGVLTSATFVCLVVGLLHRSYGFGTPELPAPQATLMKVVIEGVLQQSLPYVFVGIGVAIALVVEALRLPSLPFAVGVYLPVTTMVPVFLGGLLKAFMEKRAASKEDAASRRSAGILFGSGLVGGEGLLGVGIAAYAVAMGKKPAGVGYEWAGAAAPFVGLGLFCLLVLLFARAARGER